VARRTQDILLVQDITIDALAELAETRDPETGNHIRRTREYVRILAMRLQGNPRYAEFLTLTTIELLAKSAPLHDIGKVGIPDHILLKPGKLSADEWIVMKTHARIGANAIEHAIEHAERHAARPVAFLGLAREIAHWHHEKWDGSGYPDGLAGDAIPMSARLMALADVFDALISPRVYKEPIPFDWARAIIAAGSGGHFEPDVVAAFLAGFDDFTDVAERYREDKTTVPGHG
jgi:putative two-component system response regulator